MCVKGFRSLTNGEEPRKESQGGKVMGEEGRVW